MIKIDTTSLPSFHFEITVEYQDSFTVVAWIDI